GKRQGQKTRRHRSLRCEGGGAPIQIASLADGVLPFQTVPSEWHLASPHTALHRAEHERVGCNPDPSAAIMDSQSGKTVEESAHIRRYDAHQCVKGRKPNLLADTSGLPIANYATPPGFHDTLGPRKLLGGLAFF